MKNGNEMDELEKNLPDDFWRKAFDEAAETPPPRVWAIIERRLDESDGPKILPLWGAVLASSRPLVMWGTGLAATVALLLVGWWVVNTQSGTQSVAQTQRVNQTQRVATSKGLPAEATPAAVSTDKANNRQADAIVSIERALSKSVRLVGSAAQSLSPKSAERVAQSTTKLIGPINSVEIQPEPALASIALRTTTAFEFNSSVSRGSIVSYAANGRSSAAASKQLINSLAAYNKLEGKPFRLRRPGMIQRIVWIRPAELEMTPEVNKSRQKTREMWASVSMMPGSFNPLVSVQSVQPASTALVSAATSSQSAVNSRANFSVAYQAGAGVQLTEHWSVESGIGYLSGHSMVETPGQQALASGQMDILANRNAGNSNLYVDALRTSSQATTVAASVPQAGYSNVVANTLQAQSVYDSRNLQTVSNNYQYVQVPVQVGYQFRPRKRLSMAVLGGLLTNIFVRNTVGDALVVTGKDGVYRPVSLAATMGARFRYRPSRRWSASLAGVYQPSLEAGTKADSQVQSHPTSAGMSFGVDYHF